MKTDSLQQYLVLQQSLRREKTALELRLTRINAVLANRGTSVADSRAAGKARRVRRPLPRIKNPMSLRAAVNKVTRGRPLTKKEILKAIGKLGYRFATKNPMNTLNATLYANKQFKNQNGKFSPA